MRVRVPNLLGKDVHDASFIDFPDELSDDPKATKRVLEVRPAGGEALRLEKYSADEIELVEASPAEEKELAEQGFDAVQRPG
ncbi:MAG TPA: hypothetical protein VHE35_13780 [Kofleriaceae bacterium]|nr:hypothetical protein [Kofleriaceae bacterium]